ncbi:DUF1972 domain-containing protein [Thiosocius teredinicola]|uniref:DUF1972 domain-containing protein n=1 Tax=Thiosocius teredinicola TaxID=1973002 RepID=UPI00099113C2
MSRQRAPNRKRIAILGSRGIPSEFGGFETFAEQLSIRLVEKGFDVTVFCERFQQYHEPTYKGVKLIYIATPRLVGLRSVWFDIASVVRTLRGYDVVYMLGYHAAFAFVLPWIFRTNFWTNMDGLEWKRDKWSSGAKRYLRVMEWFAARFSRRLVADAEGIAEHLRTHYGAAEEISMIPYGAHVVDDSSAPSAEDLFGLSKDEYYLVVCRLEPENHVREIIEGFVMSSSSRSLIIVGDHETHTAYVQSLLNVADDRVRFVGVIFDSVRLAMLRRNCRAYFHGHSVGGTNPSLLEAMGCGNFVVAHDNRFNREVTGGHAMFFSTPDDVRQSIERLESDVPTGPRQALLARIETIYNWEIVADTYEKLIESS